MDFNRLIRYPIQKDERLQAWNSADELLIDHTNGLDLNDKRILILNDLFGALSCFIESQNITVYSDSFLSCESIKINSNNKVQPLNDLSQLDGTYDIVVIQIPKNLNFLEDLLCHLTKHINQDTQIICGGMVKHISKKVFSLTEKYIGSVTTSLARKKARLLFSSFEKNIVGSKFPVKSKYDNIEKTFLIESNVFSGNKLDIGTRFFLNHIPDGDYSTIVDLGCGNGIVGIHAQNKFPQSKIIFTDESSMAIKCAKQNYKVHCSASPSFHWTNCFEIGEQASVDLILCNPPFHQNHTIGTHIAKNMFENSKSLLKEGGVLRIIGNHHLKYQVMLKKIFGKSKIIESNNKFMIVDSIK